VRVGFKEWAVVVDALGQGDQILILRKGGISEGSSGFQVEHNRFVLFPTLFHQQREFVVPSAQARYDVLAPKLSPSTVRIEFIATVIDWRVIDSLETALRLRGQHIWRDEVVAERFERGSPNVYAMALRVYRLPVAAEVPMMPHYAGCKSWVELDTPIPTAGSEPVLSEGDFKEKFREFENVLGPARPVIANAF
jgi:hypothetical protein